jgi:hypothetical protein
LLNHSELIAHYDDYNLRLAEIKSGIYLGWIYVFYTIGVGRLRRQYSEYQWMIVIDHAVSSFNMSELPDHSKYLYEMIDNVLFIKAVRMATFNEGEQLFEYLKDIA